MLCEELTIVQHVVRRGPVNFLVFDKLRPSIKVYFYPGNTQPVNITSKFDEHLNLIEVTMVANIGLSGEAAREQQQPQQCKNSESALRTVVRQQA